MQFIDLQKQYERLKPEIDEAVQKVLSSSRFIMGEEVRLLEERLAAYAGTAYCITCANGTDALSLAMMVYGIGPGDAVFVPTFTFYASAETVSGLGATPVFVDIDPATFNIDPADLRKAIGEVEREGRLKPRAVIAVDLFGLPCDFPSLQEICKEYNLLLVEDGAQGFGGAIDGKKACSFGDIATTSFFPAKPLGCYGDGGAIFTDEEKVAAYLRSLRVHGMGEDKYDNVRIGMNSRLDTLQAAILLPKLAAFEEYELAARSRAAEWYCVRLSDIVTTPRIPAGYFSSYAQYSVLFDSEKERNQIQEALNFRGIPTMIYYRTCMHQQTVYRNNSSIHRGFGNAESVSARILNLPMHPYLTEEDVREICEALREARKCCKTL